MSSINDYYRQKIRAARNEIISKGDDFILKVKPSELIEYYFRKDSLPIIEKDSQREIEYEQKSPMRSTMGGFVAGRRLIVTIKYPIIPHERIIEVLKRQSSTYYPNRYSLVYENGCIISQIELQIEGSGQEKRFEREIKTIKEILEQKNNDVTKQNQSFKFSLKQFVEEYQNRVKKDVDLLESIIKKIPYSIKRKEKISASPIDLKFKKTIRPIYPKAENHPEPYLERDKVDSVVEIIKNAGKGFEITPHVYNLLKEEYLRDIILGFLNAIFTLGATGESFVKKGKTDIHIVIGEGSLLTAECKKWDGLKLYSETIDQLFDYLIWRQNFGIIITFSKRLNFSEIVSKAKEVTIEHPTIRSKKIKDIGESHFITQHNFPDDAKKTVTLHHLLFNLYS